MNIRNAGSSLFRGLINIILMLFSLSCIFPIIWLINSSLLSENKFLQSSINIAFHPMYQNYISVLKLSGLLQATINSGYLSFFTVIILIIFSVVTGYFISRYKFRFKSLIYILFLCGMVVPILSLLIPVFIQFNYIGLLNHRYTLLLPYVAFAMPLAVILTDNYISSLPRELDEAAYMEGCGTTKMLTSVIFPLCVPILSIVIITSFIGAWNEFPFSLVLIKDQSMYTISLCLRMFKQEHTSNYTVYMAALFMSIIPIVVVYIIFSKRIMESMTIGAVKG